MRRLVLACAVLLSVAAPARAAQLEAMTPSGLPDVVFVLTGLPTASTRIVTACMDAGWGILEQAANQVSCRLPLVGFDAAMATADVRHGVPKQFARVNLVQVGDHTRAQAQVILEEFSPAGPSQRVVATADMYNAMLGLLQAAGGQLPIGTTFPETLYLGVQLSAKESRASAVIESVTAGSPAASAGLQPGDRIVAVDGKPVKNAGVALKALGRVKLGADFNLGVQRHGAPVVIALRAHARPPVTSLGPPTEAVAP